MTQLTDQNTSNQTNKLIIVIDDQNSDEKLLFEKSTRTSKILGKLKNI